MNINLELYKVFYYVAKTLSFSEASKKLFISQSAVSQSIRMLEKKLDTSLFFRNTKKVTLTNEGKLLMNHIEPALNLINSGEKSIIETHTLVKGQLHIGASDTICKYFLIPYFKKFHQLYPNIHIQVTNRTSIKCVDLLKQGSVDLIVTNLPNVGITKSMESITVREFNDVFIAGNEFKQLNNKILTFKELIQYPILMLEKNTTTSQYINDIFQDYNLEINPDIELGSIDLLVDLAKIGLGISFVPEFCLSSKDKHEIFSIKTKESIPKRTLGIVINKKVPLSISSEKFIELFKNL